MLDSPVPMSPRNRNSSDPPSRRGSIDSSLLLPDSLSAFNQLPDISLDDTTDRLRDTHLSLDDQLKAGAWVQSENTDKLFAKTSPLKIPWGVGGGGGGGLPVGGGEGRGVQSQRLTNNMSGWNL